MRGYIMCYMLAVLTAVGLTGLFMLAAACEAGHRGLYTVPCSEIPHTVRERLGYDNARAANRELPAMQHTAERQQRMRRVQAAKRGLEKAKVTWFTLWRMVRIELDGQKWWYLQRDDYDTRPDYTFRRPRI